ncbi:MAG: PKD domain-containing protein [Candidatus Thermoplasmatota archaeon]|nr:PKD domain-containing protein [Candidatus Thermoplasmatota archaeon]
MKIHNISKAAILIVIIMLISNTALSFQTLTINKNLHNNTQLPTQLFSVLSLEMTSPQISLSRHTTLQPLGNTSTIDQYQTYGNCWVGTNNHVIKIAQSFIPTHQYLDYIQLKIWINFTQPITPITCYLYTSNNNQPYIVAPNGNAELYTSQEFPYSSITPNPNDHNQCPWSTIDFPDNPHTIPGERYWLVIEVGIPLPSPKHVWLGALINTTDQYPNGTIAYHYNTWHVLPNIDLMFITYGLSTINQPPTADAGGPYYGYIVGGETIQLDASFSHDNDEGGNHITSYEWKFHAQDTWHQTTHAMIDKTYTSPGTYTVTLRVSDNEGDTDATITHVTIYPAGLPHITHIDSFYADGSTDANNQGFFLQGLNLTNKYTAHAAGNQIDKVEFTFDSTTYIDTQPQDGWNLNINTDAILNPFTTLTARAHNQYGWGPEYTLAPRIIPLAGWLFHYLQYLQNNSNYSFVTFTIGIRDSPPLLANNFWTISASIDLSCGSPLNTTTSPVTATVDVPVDDIEGTYSYSGGIGSSISIISDGSIDISGNFQSSVTIKDIAGYIAASLHGKITISNTIIWEYMYLIINGQVTIPVFYFPFEIYGIGIEAGIDITPHVEITFNLEPAPFPHQGLLPGLGIKIKDEQGIIGNVGAEVCAHADIGFGIGELYTEAGGDATLYFQTPSPPGYLKDFILDCWIGGRIQILSWVYEGWWEYQWRYLTDTPPHKTYNETPWTILDRAYLNPIHGTYNTFIYNDTATGTVIQNIYPYAYPVIESFPQSAGTKNLLIWTVDNPQDPAVQSLGLQYSIWEKDIGMTVPIAISSSTQDNQLQMYPQIGFDASGNALCVFIQTPSSVTATTPLLQAMASSELAYSTYNTSTTTWGPIHTITQNDHADFTPQLVANEQGQLLLIWIADLDSNITTINDRQLYGSFWNGTTWTPPQNITPTIPILSPPHAIHRINRQGTWEAYISITLDQDTNQTTTTDQDIYITYVNTTLTNTTHYPLTTNSSQQHTHASLVYGYDTHPYCIWAAPTINTTTCNPTMTTTLYYQTLDTHRSSPHIITTGNISTPYAFISNGFRLKETPNFVVGWTTTTDNTLNCAIINQNQSIERGSIYGSTNQLTQTTWEFGPGGIAALTLERPSLKKTDKHCNLTYVYTPGFDTIPPQTTCTLQGEFIQNSLYGPIYHKNVTLTLSPTDQGLAGLATTYYCLDNGAWTTYTTPIIIETQKAHILRYYSIDKAGNSELQKIQQVVVITSQQPMQPLQPCGPTHGTVGKEYLYYTQATDPDNDPLYYKWKWGDEFSPWLGPYENGDFCVIPHTWTKKGTYIIQVIAKDCYNKQSSWSDPLEIRMPINQESTIISITSFFTNSCCTNQQHTKNMEKSYIQIAQSPVQQAGGK